MNAKKIMLRQKCSVPQCNNRKTDNNSLHVLPKNEGLRNQWVELLRIKFFRISDKVCNDHFAPDDFFPSGRHTLRRKLKPHVVPSLNLPIPYTFSISNNAIVATESLFRGQLSNDTNNMSRDSSSDVTNNEIFIIEEDKIENLENEATTSNSIRDVPYHRGTQASAKCTVAELIKTREQLYDSTGITSFKLLTHLESCVVEVETMKLNQMKFDVSVKDRIVLTLMKLRMNLTDDCLAVMFSISRDACSWSINRTIESLKDVMSCAIQWPPREEVKKKVPLRFRKYFPQSVFLSCQDIKIEKQSNVRSHIATYSHYEGKNTAKFLIATTPGGTISYLSKAYGGRSSDKQILVKSRLLDKLYRDDTIMIGNKGFSIESECQSFGIHLKRAPLLDRKKQIPAILRQNTSIASVRQHVERTLQCINTFKICNGPIPYNLNMHINSIMTIICGIINLRPLRRAPVAKFDTSRTWLTNDPQKIRTYSRPVRPVVQEEKS